MSRAQERIRAALVCCLCLLLCPQMVPIPLIRALEGSLLKLGAPQARRS